MFWHLNITSNRITNLTNLMLLTFWCFTLKMKTSIEEDVSTDSLTEIYAENRWKMDILKKLEQNAEIIPLGTPCE